jgi:predicted  nucleic acid-binding Zn-ribbon protein
MGNPLPTEGTPFPQGGSVAASAGGSLSTTWSRVAAFRFTYVAVFIFLLLYVFSVKATETALTAHFRERLATAANVDPTVPDWLDRVRERVDAELRASPWVRWGGAQVNATVVGPGGSALLYSGGRGVAVPGKDSAVGPDALLLPPTVDVTVLLPHNALLANAILVGYASLLLTTLFVWGRTLARREEQRLAEVLAARDGVAARAASFQAELDAVRERLGRLEPEREEFTAEIHSLQGERALLLEKLAALERREGELRAQSGQNSTLEQERGALEELLEEALHDLEQRNDEIRELQQQVKKAGRAAAPGGRLRESEILERRLRTLYKNLEVDDRAISDIAALGDEATRLKAEEAVKRLCEEADNVAVRRKVGGLPPHLSIFEIGFAGKGRIYYTNGRQRRYRLLAVGAKNSQKTDLEYLSRLPKE